MKTSFLKSIGAMAGIVVTILFVIWALSLWLDNKKFALRNQVYSVMIDSLQADNERAYYVIDSLETVLIREKTEYNSMAGKNASQFKYYKRKLKDYEKIINGIGGMSDPALLDSITGYLDRRFGYGR